MGDEYSVRIAGVTTGDDGLEFILAAKEYPQALACQDCGSLAVWAEGGYTPGHRICNGCDSHYSVTPIGAVEYPDGAAEHWPREYLGLTRYRVRRARFH